MGAGDSFQDAQELHCCHLKGGGLHPKTSGSMVNWYAFYKPLIYILQNLWIRGVFQCIDISSYIIIIYDIYHHICQCIPWSPGCAPFHSHMYHKRDTVQLERVGITMSVHFALLISTMDWLAVGAGSQLESLKRLPRHNRKTFTLPARNGILTEFRIFIYSIVFATVKLKAVFRAKGMGR